jgi:hypothetical protein
MDISKLTAGIVWAVRQLERFGVPPVRIKTEQCRCGALGGSVIEGQYLAGGIISPTGPD